MSDDPHALIYKDGNFYVRAERMLGSDASKATCAKNAQVQPASAAVPSEEEIARAIYHGKPRNRPWDILPHEFKNQYRKQARAVLALFAPVLAEKERLIRELAALLDKQLGTPCEQIRHRQEADDLRARIANLTDRPRLPVIADYIEVQNHSRAMEARALAAEAALAGRDAEIAKAVAEAYEDAAKVRESRIEKLPLSSSSSDYDCEAAACAAATPEDNGA